MQDELAGLYGTHVATVQGRFEQALNACGLDCVIIAAGEEHVAFLDDRTYPFRVNPLFNYWVPLESVPGSCIVVRPGKPPCLIHLQPDDFWYKPPETPHGFWTEEFDIRMISEAAQARDHFPSRLERCAWLAEPPPPVDIPHVNPQPLINRLHYDRAAKTEYELECMRRATDVAVRGHRAAATAFRAGGSEYDIHLAYLEATGHTDSELPYQNIIALNENGAVLHYQHLERKKPREIHSFLIDAGANFNGYACDISRTYSHSDPDFEGLVEAMDALQRTLCDKALPGVDYRELHMEAHLGVAGILGEAGLVSGPAQAIVDSGISRVFFPHGVGHLIGLQVHDVGGHQAGPEGGELPPPAGHNLRLTRVLEEDFVVTIEPGIYFIDSLLESLRAGSARNRVKWSAVDAFRKFGGVRVEDDVRVRSGGVENLTRRGFDRSGG